MEHLAQICVTFIEVLFDENEKNNENDGKGNNRAANFFLSEDVHQR